MLARDAEGHKGRMLKMLGQESVAVGGDGFDGDVLMDA